MNIYYILLEMHKNMKTMDELKQEVAATVLPQDTKELFYRIIDTAEVASLSEQDRMRFEAEWKGYLDTMSCLEMAEEKGLKKGMEQGIEQGVINVARSMKIGGVDYAIISKHTNLTISDIEKL